MHEHSQPDAPLRALAISGVATLAAAGALWASQAIPALKINESVLFSSICWLFVFSCFALKTSQVAPRSTWVSRTMAIAIASRQEFELPEPGRTPVDVASRRIYRRCGHVAVVAVAAMAVLDLLLACGAVHLEGVNLVLTTLFVLTVARECMAVRILGARAAGAERAVDQALAAAHYGAPGGCGTLTVLKGGSQPTPKGRPERG